jgi:hypothetical protein
MGTELEALSAASAQQKYNSTGVLDEAFYEPKELSVSFKDDRVGFLVAHQWVEPMPELHDPIGNAIPGEHLLDPRVLGLWCDLWAMYNRYSPSKGDLTFGFQFIDYMTPPGVEGIPNTVWLPADYEKGYQTYYSVDTSSLDGVGPRSSADLKNDLIDGNLIVHNGEIVRREPGYLTGYYYTPVAQKFKRSIPRRRGLLLAQEFAFQGGVKVKKNVETTFHEYDSIGNRTNALGSLANMKETKSLMKHAGIEKETKGNLEDTVDKQRQRRDRDAIMPVGGDHDEKQVEQDVLNHMHLPTIMKLLSGQDGEVGQVAALFWLFGNVKVYETVSGVRECVVLTQSLSITVRRDNKKRNEEAFPKGVLGRRVDTRHFSTEQTEEWTHLGDLASRHCNILLDYYLNLEWGKLYRQTSERFIDMSQQNNREGQLEQLRYFRNVLFTRAGFTARVNLVTQKGVQDRLSLYPGPYNQMVAYNETSFQVADGVWNVTSGWVWDEEKGVFTTSGFITVAYYLTDSMVRFYQIVGIQDFYQYSVWIQGFAVAIAMLQLSGFAPESYYWLLGQAGATVRVGVKSIVGTIVSAAGGESMALAGLLIPIILFSIDNKD